MFSKLFSEQTAGVGWLANGLLVKRIFVKLTNGRHIAKRLRLILLLERIDSVSFGRERSTERL